MTPFVTAELPDRRSLLRQWHKVVGPRGNKKVHIRTLSNDLLAVWTHYDESIKRVRPCHGEGCPFCKKQERRFLAYGAGQDQATRQLVVYEVTEGAYRKLCAMGLLPGKMRGHLLTLARKGTACNAPVVPEIESMRFTDDLPPAFDVKPSLLRLWGWNDQHAEQLKKKAAAGPKTGPQLVEGDDQADEGQVPY